jgi:hypothetical protein
MQDLLQSKNMKMGKPGKKRTKAEKKQIKRDVLTGKDRRAGKVNGLRLVLELLFPV